MDPLMQISPQSLAGIMQAMQMKRDTQQQQQAVNQSPQQTVPSNMLGLWGA